MTLALPHHDAAGDIQRRNGNPGCQQSNYPSHLFRGKVKHKGRTCTCPCASIRQSAAIVVCLHMLLPRQQICTGLKVTIFLYYDHYYYYHSRDMCSRRPPQVRTSMRKKGVVLTKRIIGVTERGSCGCLSAKVSGKERRSSLGHFQIETNSLRDVIKKEPR